MLIGDVEVAPAVRRYASGRVELRLGRRAAVPAEPALFRAGNGGDCPGGIDLADAVVAPIGDVEIARAVHHHARGES